jgi:hypothetical protein
MERIPDTFDAFWALYLRAHHDWRNRALHFAGTAGGLVLLAAGILTLNPLLVVAAPIWGYGLAWIGHYVFEHNRPLAFKKFLWSFRADMRMFVLTLTGRIGEEMKRMEGEAAAAE